MALGTIAEESSPASPSRGDSKKGGAGRAAVTAAAQRNGQRPSETRTKGDMRLSEKISKCIVEARCTDNVLFAAAVTIGGCALLLQSLPLLSDSWVFLTEPRPVNKTNENGEQMEAVYDYNIGYFRVCREFRGNRTTNSLETEPEIPKLEADLNCHINPLFSRTDLTDFSVASLAVIMRLGVPALLHTCGATVCWFAFCLGMLGHFRRTFSTLFSAIAYICGSIVLSTAVLMFVCVVDDELAPRMKPNAAGEPSKFSFRYGFPFYSSSLSFIPVQVCACLHAFLYFRRYPSVAEKLRFVPGLEAKLRHAQLDKQLGIPPLEQWKRGSLASYLPLPSFVSGRPSPSHSSLVSNSHSIVFMQDV